MKEKSLQALASGYARSLLDGWAAGSLAAVFPEVETVLPMGRALVAHGEARIVIRAIADLIDCGGIAVDPTAGADFLVTLNRARMVASP